MNPLSAKAAAINLTHPPVHAGSPAGLLARRPASCARSRCWLWA
jgi:hypothetical protein